MSELKTIKTSGNGIEYLNKTLQQKLRVATKVCLWGINHKSPQRETTNKVKDIVFNELGIELYMYQVNVKNEEFDVDGLNYLSG